MVRVAVDSGISKKYDGPHPWARNIRYMTPLIGALRLSKKSVSEADSCQGNFFGLSISRHQITYQLLLKMSVVSADVTRKDPPNIWNLAPTSGLTSKTRIRKKDGTWRGTW
ncbi:predicted protein [Histoplasma capsulatum H143]|uniref:Uncharacterized protein n=1 Tax=Ajellomyces capsulatus (strain H143) TaxID=544712 RepID=C6H239_AJECH|nr:predicted protein [Histoplasma capsulatum H143]